MLAVLGVMAWGTRASANSAGAVVLINSQSAKYPDFQHFVQPYLGNFGVPYTVLDISSNGVGPALTNYALIIIGHAQLDTNNVFLNAAAQSNLALAVSNGTGLVNFDNVLSGVSNAPLYSFEQTIFGFGYTNVVSGPTVIFPPTGPSNSMHFITSLHQTNQVLQLSNNASYSTMTVAGLQLTSNATAVATCGGSPFVVTAGYGQGRAVQWASYAWMSSTVQGPVNGLDDLVWRGMVWAARKPFVMRGFPNFATFRIDDAAGPFWWLHAATNAGFQPHLALFTQDITDGQNTRNDGSIADLRSMTASGLVTTSMHSFSINTNNFFYFNHATETQWPDAVMSNNYAVATQWFQANAIPISQVIAPHYAEIGTNAFNGLTNWGVEFVLLTIVPGTVEYVGPGTPWLVAGPYRLYDPPQNANNDLPDYYADFLPVPNHPELNGKFFTAACWIHNVGAGGEFAPADGDIAGSINRGANMLKRGFDSMTLATLLTHEWYMVNPGNYTQLITTNHWQQILSGITSNLAPYNPTYVTLDYGCQYLRATRTSQLTNADVDPVSGRISAGLTGYTDLPISVNVYTGADNSITNTPGTVPVFAGTTNVMVGYSSVTAQLLGPVFQGSNAVFTLVGQSGCRYSIQTSADMVNWSQIQIATLSNGPVMITQPISNASQFYRAKLMP